MEVRLRVAEAKQRDVGRGKARIDSDSMNSIGATAGDVVEITGKRTTAALAWPAYQEDQGQSYARGKCQGFGTEGGSDFVDEGRLGIAHATRSRATEAGTGPLGSVRLLGALF